MPDWLQNAIPIIQIVLAIILAVLILLQNKGAGLSNVFGGDGGNVYSTKRGAERFIFATTIVVAILFFATAFINAI